MKKSLETAFFCEDFRTTLIKNIVKSTVISTRIKNKKVEKLLFWLRMKEYLLCLEIKTLKKRFN